MLLRLVEIPYGVIFKRWRNCGQFATAISNICLRWIDHYRTRCGVTSGTGDKRPEQQQQRWRRGWWTQAVGRPGAGSTRKSIKTDTFSAPYTHTHAYTRAHTRMHAAGVRRKRVCSSSAGLIPAIRGRDHYASIHTNDKFTPRHYLRSFQSYKAIKHQRLSNWTPWKISLFVTSRALPSQFNVEKSSHCLATWLQIGIHVSCIH